MSHELREQSARIVHAYLISRGWQPHENSNNSNFALYHRDGYEVDVPQKPDLVDYDKRMVEALKLVAKAERTKLSVLLDVISKHVGDALAALCATDVLSAKLDREPWSGKVHDSIKLAVAEQILRSIATEQPGASSTVKALAESYFEAVK